MKPWITSIPETTILPHAKDDDFLILASDGNWMSYQIKKLVI
jgi:serine/threonine protein phosphatase PrpC